MHYGENVTSLPDMETLRSGWRSARRARLRDPLVPASISDRDAAALRFIGEGYEVAQYQLHVAIFGDVSETVVSRFVVRAVEHELLRVERLNGMGFNRLRLTRAAIDAVCARSHVGRSYLFAPGRWVAPKDLAHTLWINDLRVVFGTSSTAPNILLPAWATQRATGSASLVPDLLAIWRSDAVRPGLVLACEIDLGTEPLQSLFVPKLVRLADTLRPGDRENAAIVVLTRGPQRRASLKRLLSRISDGVEIIILDLPSVSGRNALPELRLKLGMDAASIRP